MELVRPTDERFQRRLAAVLMLDIAGYSRLSEADVEGTHSRLRLVMNGVVLPSLARTSGRIVKRTGDGALIEFPSVTEAVRAAISIQRQTAEVESDRPPDRRLRLRMGINLGDIIVDDGDIYGDGVNIAARLEGIGKPGDIILSDAAVQTVDWSGYRFVDLGQQRLKNISRLVRAYRLVMTEDADGQPVAADSGGSPNEAAASVFGERPAVAVLPFRVEAGLADIQSVADAITEDLISALARWRTFPVISRHTVFAYRGRDVDLKSVALQVGARYFVEGSLRRHGAAQRVQIELVDVESMDHLLTEQYDYGTQDISALQDEVVIRIGGAVHPELLRQERDRAVRSPSAEPSAYECLQRGLWHHYRYSPADSEQACGFFRHALSIDKGFAQASAALAITLGHAAHVGWVDRQVCFAEALGHARNAVLADPRDPTAHFALAGIYQHIELPQDAVSQLQEAIQLNPAYAAAYANLALNYCFLGRHDEALGAMETCLRLGAHDPRRFVWLPGLAMSHYLGGRYRDALAACQEALTVKPDHPVAVRYLVATLGQLGRRTEAQAVIHMLRRLDGGIAGSEAYLRRFFKVEATVQHIVDGLRKAGLD